MRANTVNFYCVPLEKRLARTPKGYRIRRDFFFLIQPSLKQLEWCFVFILISSNHQLPLSKRKKRDKSQKHIWSLWSLKKKCEKKGSAYFAFRYFIGCFNTYILEHLGGAQKIFTTRRLIFFTSELLYNNKQAAWATFFAALEAASCFRMKPNISFPATGCQKLIEVGDELKLCTFEEKRVATEVAAGALGEEWKNYMVRISGGNDKQGLPMKQGVVIHGRVRLVLSKGHSCDRPRRTGERKHRSLQGCIVDANLSARNLVIVKKKKKEEKDIPGLTNTTVPRHLGPKRPSRIHKLFNL